MSAPSLGARRTLSARLRGNSARILFGAAAFTILSRMVGLVRESVMVGMVGVHDYTDAYFALAAVVMWLQNWSFGAYALYFVPKYRSLPRADKTRFLTAALRRMWMLGAILGVLFALLGRRIERFLLAGHNVLDARGFAVFALCLPVTAVAGVYYARNVSEESGLIRAARALFVGNLGGVMILATLVLAPFPDSLVLPTSLAFTQLSLLLLLRINPKHHDASDDGTHAPPTVSNGSQAWATTVENVGFNLNAIGQQAIAGMLPMGGVTLNAYAIRLLLVPITGLLQPVQQRLLIRFSAPATQERGSVRGPVLFGSALGLFVGGCAALVLHLLTPYLSQQWQDLIRTHHFAYVVLLYGSYAGVVFSNQALARFAFANHCGWTYAVVMVLAYAIGTGTNLLLLDSLGLVSLPLTSVGAEVCATLLLLQLLRRSLFTSGGGAHPSTRAMAES